MRRLLLTLTLAGAAFAGQSIQFVGANVSNYASFPVPATMAGTPVRVEFMIHDWTDNTDIFGVNGLGFSAGILAGESGSALFVKNQWSNPNDQQQIYLVPGATHDPALSTKIAYFRIQYAPSLKQVSIEAWDVNGLRFFNSVVTYPSVFSTTGNSGLHVGDYSGDIGPTRAIAFFRVYNTTVPNNSRVPVTADTTATVLNAKFDGNLNDFSGNGYNGTLGGSASYVTTPGQNVQAVAKTAGAPFWANTVTQRAGFPAQIDASNSYSQADASATVSCFWQVLQPAPSVPLFDSRTSCTPTLTGLVFGDYPIQLTVTDSAGTQATLTQHIGAVATDANGVVVNGNPDVDKLFGPMIAWGKNPWGFLDYINMRSMTLRNTSNLDPAKGSLGTPGWETPGAGTITYHVNGVNLYVGAAGGTTLNGAITASQTTITLTDASTLDFSELPTRIVIGLEEIRICSVSGNVLTVCYDGRGAGVGPGISALNGAQVGQWVVRGTGTKFITDPNTAICPTGAPGFPGSQIYNTGTVTLTAGSTALVGTGTAWAAPLIVPGGGAPNAGTRIRVTATHGGTPFVFLALVSTITDGTHIIMNRPFPATADTGSYSYVFIQDNQSDIRGVLHYARATDGSDAKYSDFLSGCESETSWFATYASHDFGGVYNQPGLNGSLQSGKQYSAARAVDQGNYLNSGSLGGINFYGPGLGDRSLYYRSGIKLAETTANMIDDNWIKSPQVAGHDAGGIDLYLGGGVIGAVADAVLNVGRVSWNDIRGFARYADWNFANSKTGPCLGPRESGYFSAWLNLAALYDPDVTQRAVWNTDITNDEIPYENSCKNTDPSGVHPERVNSWASSLVPYGSPLVGLTNGSTAGTFPSTASNICRDSAHGTATATNGSTALTGTGFVAGSLHITLTGTKAGVTFAELLAYTYNSPTSITLAGVWQGDTGTVNYIQTSDQNQLSFGSQTNISDPQFYEFYTCTYNSGAGTFTLNRPWTGATSPNTNVASIYNLSGTGTQPYMMGIKNAGFRFGAFNTNSTTATAFTNFATAESTWIHDYGFDPVAHALYYGRVFGGCEPDPNGSGASCQSAASLNAEAQSSLWSYYLAHPTGAGQLYGDQFYAANWGNPNGGYTTGGVLTDVNYNNYLTGDSSIAGSKWPGFYFGMGASYQWPAVRLGGVAPIVTRTISVGYNLASVPNATALRILLTSPAGAVTSVTCAASPCIVPADARQGSHLMKLQYLGSGSKLLAESSETVMVAVQ